MAPGSGGGARKRAYAETTTGHPSEPDPDLDETLAENCPPPTPLSSSAPTAGGFNDPATADVLLRLHLDDSSPPSSPAPHPTFLDLHLHSFALHRSRYFAAVLSDRWLPDAADSTDAVPRLNLTVPSAATRSRGLFESHVAVLRLLYTFDFSGSILSAADALEMLPVALELLFDDCIQACVRFLEAVPWTEEEEEAVLNLIPFLQAEESRDLLARIRPETSPDGKLPSEEMLHSLILSAIHSHPKVATVKAFVAKLLRDYPSRDSVRSVLDRAFLVSLESVKKLLGEYASPDFRVAEDNDETEAIQRLSLHKAMVNARHLLWLVERMIELRVADMAVREWSEQATLVADLQRTFRDDAWRNIAPGLPSLVMRCTSRLANAVAAGSILAPGQVRMKLVKEWLPVLNVCRDMVSPMPSGHKMLYQEMEEIFLSIISTLPMSDAQELLQQCLSFSTRNVDDCPHLISAFNTWFRRANRPPYDGSTS
ncbi:BTB/POZ domain-containing protein At3g05675 [Elaeis guineensis]|uniref:BTB/POZ domain-containing protein At3g05675 n=1 Tax=Elaeis guineensis var. tenera TaxID=51953 RepID=A0A6I9SGS6_ELAGV|nr:BTB/POZ domain-containing protein At3g05675 [Elaeis guineensis]XP_029116511.1 BTB/POZ domain-containing protein At3g05675 [Elaeis guineensis]